MTHYTGKNKTVALVKAAALNRGTIVCKDIEGIEQVLKVSKVTDRDIKIPLLMKDYMSGHSKADIGPFLFYNLEEILVDLAKGFSPPVKALACS